MLEDHSCDVSNYQNVCRTCLYSGAKLTNAFDVKFDDDLLVNILKHHLFIHIKQDDQLPKLLCKNCIHEVDRIHTFINKSKYSENKLLAYNTNFHNLQSSVNYEFVEVKTEPIDNSGNKLVSVYDIKIEVPINDTLETNLKYEGTNNSENELHSLLDIKPEDDKINQIEDGANEPVENLKIGSSRNIEPVLVPQHGPPYICSCKNTFETLSDIIKHRTKTNHLQKKKYICEFCNNGKYYTFSECLKHINLHKHEQLISTTDNLRGCDREQLDEDIRECAPSSSVRSKKSAWTQFEKFCVERNYDVTSAELPFYKINVILKDWGRNMRKSDGTSYKETVVKQMWNSAAKHIQELYFKKFNTKIDPFQDIAFAEARSARDSHRKELQLQPGIRKVISEVLSKSEIHDVINSYDENTPDGLQKKFFYVATHELGWRSAEATASLVTYFNEEYDNKGKLTGRIEYNPIISTTQGGSKHPTNSKWLITNQVNKSVCPVRIFRKLVSKRGRNIQTERLFLAPYYKWTEDSFWYKNSPVGKNTIYTWAKRAAHDIGVGTKKQKVSNHSDST